MRRAAALTTAHLLLSAALLLDSASAFAAGPCGRARNPLIDVSSNPAVHRRPTLRMGGGGGGGAGVAEFAALLPGRVTASSEAAAAVIREAWRRDADIEAAPGGGVVRRELVPYTDGAVPLQGIAVSHHTP